MGPGPCWPGPMLPDTVRTRDERSAGGAPGARPHPCCPQPGRDASERFAGRALLQRGFSLTGRHFHQQWGGQLDWHYQKCVKVYWFWACLLSSCLVAVVRGGENSLRLGGGVAVSLAAMGRGKLWVQPGWDGYVLSQSLLPSTGPALLFTCGDTQLKDSPLRSA